MKRGNTQSILSYGANLLGSSKKHFLLVRNFSERQNALNSKKHQEEYDNTNHEW